MQSVTHIVVVRELGRVARGAARRQMHQLLGSFLDGFGLGSLLLFLFLFDVGIVRVDHGAGEAVAVAHLLGRRSVAVVAVFVVGPALVPCTGALDVDLDKGVDAHGPHRLVLALDEVLVRGLVCGGIFDVALLCNHLL